MNPTTYKSPRTFVAPTMAAALQSVRTELGDDAVVLRTREVERRGIGRWLTGPEIEVTAAPATPRDGAAAPIAATSPPPTSPPPTSPPPTSPPPTSPTPTSPTPTSPADRTPQPASTSRPGEPREDDRPFEGRPAGNPTLNPESQATSLGHLRLGSNAASPAVADTLATIAETVASLADDRDAHAPRVDRLIARGLPADIAREISREAARLLARGCSEDASLEAVLTQRIAVDADRPLAPGEQRRLALVGPAGVGKTTTLAKLAAAAVLDDGLNVGLITLDSHRVGAVDQSAAYAEMLSVPFHAVTGGEDARRAIGELAECDLVLVDTPGCGPRDDERFREIRTGLSSVGVDDIALCLSVAGSCAANHAAATRFESLRLTTFIATKADETPELGRLPQLCETTGLPIRLITTGQQVPTDFEWAHPDRLARLILGVDRLGESGRAAA